MSYVKIGLVSNAYGIEPFQYFFIETKMSVKGCVYIYTYRHTQSQKINNPLSLIVLIIEPNILAKKQPKRTPLMVRRRLS